MTEIALHPEDCGSNFLRFFYQTIRRHIPENEKAYFVIDAVRTAIIAIGCLFPDGFSAVRITVVQDVRHFTKFELAPCLCQAAPVHIVSFCRLSCLMVFPTTAHVLNTQAITLPTDTDIYIYIYNILPDNSVYTLSGCLHSPPTLTQFLPENQRYLKQTNLQFVHSRCTQAPRRVHIIILRNSNPVPASYRFRQIAEARLQVK